MPDESDLIRRMEMALGLRIGFAQHGVNSSKTKEELKKLRSERKRKKKASKK